MGRRAIDSLPPKLHVTPPLTQVFRLNSSLKLPLTTWKPRQEENSFKSALQSYVHGVLLLDPLSIRSRKLKTLKPALFAAREMQIKIWKEETKLGFWSKGLHISRRDFNRIRLERIDLDMTIYYIKGILKEEIYDKLLILLLMKYLSLLILPFL